MHVPILAYHNVSQQFEWGINIVSPSLFERQIRYLAEDGYQSITFRDYVSGAHTAARPVVITFDDAYRDIYHYAWPILRSYRFTATVFVVTDFVGKKNTWDINLGGRYAYHMDWQEIRQLAVAGWEIGAHTATHADLVGLNDTSLAEELRRSKQTLEQQVGQTIVTMSYPYNRFNRRVVRAVQQAGYHGACCLSSRIFLRNDYTRLTIPRRGVYAIDFLPWFKVKLMNNPAARLDDIRQKIICACSVGSVYYNQLKKLKKSIAN